MEFGTRHYCLIRHRLPGDELAVFCPPWMGGLKFLVERGNLSWVGASLKEELERLYTEGGSGSCPLLDAFMDKFGWVSYVHLDRRGAVKAVRRYSLVLREWESGDGVGALKVSPEGDCKRVLDIVERLRLHANHSYRESHGSQLVIRLCALLLTGKIRAGEKITQNDTYRTASLEGSYLQGVDISLEHLRRFTSSLSTADLSNSIITTQPRSSLSILNGAILKNSQIKASPNTPWRSSKCTWVFDGSNKLGSLYGAYIKNISFSFTQTGGFIDMSHVHFHNCDFWFRPADMHTLNLEGSVFTGGSKIDTSIRGFRGSILGVFVELESFDR